MHVLLHFLHARCSHFTCGGQVVCSDCVGIKSKWMGFNLNWPLICVVKIDPVLLLSHMLCLAAFFPVFYHTQSERETVSIWCYQDAHSHCSVIKCTLSIKLQFHSISEGIFFCIAFELVSIQSTVQIQLLLLVYLMSIFELIEN